ncbi:MAG: TraR/DksA family transcriptional regulator [Flavobacteriales bacterium]|nr:TraR/DksA family transcriptional regulator [Flavobacteriales bacterium]
MKTAPTTPLRYSPEELQEFQTLINAKLAKTEETLNAERGSLMRLSSSSTDDTYLGHVSLEEGNMVMEREDLARSVVRLEKHIQDLKLALGRIRTGEYGICRSTGQMIPKERLRVVPHATLTVEAKNQRPEPRQENTVPRSHTDEDRETEQEG